MEGDRMNTKQLECFIQAAQILNFSVAAKRLYVTQPTVTHQIKTLEEELGVRLFRRGKKNVTLTTEGSIFYKDAQEIIMREDIAKSRVLNTQKNYRSKIAVSFEANVLEQAYLPGFIKKHHAVHPEIYLYIQKFNFKLGIQNLLEHKMDLLLYTSREAVEHAEIEHKALCSVNFVCLVEKDSKLSRKSAVTLEDLKNQFLIIPSAVSSTVERKSILAALQNANPIYYCDDVQTAHILTKGGLGVSILPDIEVFDDPALESVPLALPKEISLPPYGIAWHKGERRPEIHRFIHQLAEEFTKHTDAAAIAP
jgi:LysR family transcriptional regulator, hca operon transcriptional activator